MTDPILVVPTNGKYCEAKFDAFRPAMPILLLTEGRTYSVQELDHFGATLPLHLNYEGGDLPIEERGPNLLSEFYDFAIGIARDSGATHFSLEGLTLNSQDPSEWMALRGKERTTKIRAHLQRYVFEDLDRLV